MRFTNWFAAGGATVTDLDEPIDFEEVLEITSRRSWPTRPLPSTGSDLL